MIRTPPLDSGCSSIAIDEMDLEDEEATVEVPLKLKRSISNNFPDLAVVHRKARVTSRVTDSQSKKEVEELLEHAAEWNNLMACNLSVGDSFGSDLLQKGWPRKPDNIPNVLDELESEEVLSWSTISTPGSMRCINAGLKSSHVEYDDFLSRERALQLLKEDTAAILSLSEGQRCDNSDISPFEMRTAATVTFEEYLDRINAKCHFGAEVYLTAHCLFQRLTMQQLDSLDNERRWHVKRPITLFHVHYLIAALVRVSAKIVNDSIHSHEYFSRVCGISKKLLTKLELSLILAIHQEGLNITTECLKTPNIIHQQLQAQPSEAQTNAQACLHSSTHETSY
ncbi:HER107Cp [Eremothecium sinecaudum]|uniref:HER107Cp n=1 Tax=Eremothecium sinecaudum TaxID=45286 RepID=A0A0X8HT75_9SACH|nr:HER107Cp [Eremothecium sinecaudum]AMD21386.1 HER107Cp [Eremothecium sinecaudum]